MSDFGFVSASCLDTRQVARQLILQLLMDLSEYECCASWMNGVDRAVADIVTGNDVTEPPSYFTDYTLDEDEIALFRHLATVAGGWPRWDDDLLLQPSMIVQLPSEDAPAWSDAWINRALSLACVWEQAPWEQT